VLDREDLQAKEPDDIPGHVPDDRWPEALATCTHPANESRVHQDKPDGEEQRIDERIASIILNGPYEEAVMPHDPDQTREGQRSSQVEQLGQTRLKKATPTNLLADGQDEERDDEGQRSAGGVDRCHVGSKLDQPGGPGDQVSYHHHTGWLDERKPIPFELTWFVHPKLLETRFSVGEEQADEQHKECRKESSPDRGCDEHNSASTTTDGEGQPRTRNYEQNKYTDG